jgi:hypothetical protein
MSSCDREPRILIRCLTAKDMAAFGKMATCEAVNVNTVPSRIIHGARGLVSRLAVLKLEPGLFKVCNVKCYESPCVSRLASCLMPATIPLSLQAVLSMSGVELENAFT